MMMPYCVVRSRSVTMAEPQPTPRMWGRTGARCRDCSQSVSPARPPHRTCGFHRIRRSPDGHCYAGTRVSALLVQGVGMLLARHRYRVTGIVVASNMTSPSTAGR
jgi:hypothetical protein